MSRTLDRSHLRFIRRVALVVLVVGVAGVLIDGAARPADPSLSPTDLGAPAARFPDFHEVSFTVTGADALVDNGSGRSFCGLLAATNAQRDQGLRGRRGLAGYAAMVFTWPTPTESGLSTGAEVPLSIAWFDEHGNYVGDATIAPCPSPAHCPAYRPAVPYRYAVEVPAGHLTDLGVGVRSVLALTGPCVP